MKDRAQTPAEELVNSLTCGAGLVLSVAALVLVVLSAASHRGAAGVTAASLYGTSLVLMFLFSALYHSLPRGGAKRLFEILDHCGIYLLIAGTYMPITLITLRGAWGWSLFGVVWVLAVAGILFKIVFIDRLRALSAAVYLLMGWLIVVALVPLTQHLPVEGIVWLAAGGMAFTVGILFFAIPLRFAHAIWHGFVLAGCACHFFAVFFFVLPD